ncbi:hypothetical protein [Rhodococcus sp. YH1]|uniref:hypothetical protein n=1 Tax=Rhodococcus sp. YH1 TaxID=89066 RepID=UPI0013872D70|nr:hypothetical protein [Rhodococcus sp. YH1]
MTHAAFALPPLAGVRGSAQQLTQHLPADSGPVVVECAALLAGTGGYADELIRQLLVERHALSVVFRGLREPEFRSYLIRQAAAHGVSDRIAFEEPSA